MKIFLFTLLISEASFADTNLTTVLKIDLAKKVNQAVSPVKPDCASAGKTSRGDTRDVQKNLMKNFVMLGGDPISLIQAMCFMDRYSNQKFKAAGDPSRSNGIKIDNQRYVTINDLNAGALNPRLFVLDLQTGKVEAFLSGHGEGGHAGVAASDLYVKEFSNKDGSHATPRGFFITGVRREGSSDPRWKYSMKLHGLQEGINDKSFSRAVIMHPFPGIPNDTISSDDANPVNKETEGTYGLSYGCTMLSEGNASTVINKIKASNNSNGGSLYYNYTPVEKERGETYCGEEKLMKK